MLRGVEGLLVVEVSGCAGLVVRRRPASKPAPADVIDAAIVRFRLLVRCVAVRTRQDPGIRRNLSIEAALCRSHIQTVAALRLNGK